VVYFTLTASLGVDATGGEVGSLTVDAGSILASEDAGTAAI